VNVLQGITLAAAVAMALSELTGRDVPYAYNRKEAKDHGEGGNIVGASMQVSLPPVSCINPCIGKLQC
jgi:orotate phosphoribosyltransferase